MADTANTLSTPLMTRYEFDRMKALEANGMSHDAAKAQIYGERGPGGAPVVGDSGSVGPGAASVAPDASVAVTTSTGGSNIGWLLVLGAVGAATYYYIKHKKTGTPLIGDLVGEMNTGVLSAPKRRKRRRK